MANATEEFFDELGRRGHEPLVARVHGALRFDVTQHGKTDVYRLIIDGGHLTVSRDPGHADCVIRVDRAVLDGIVSGRMNAMAALLRGALAAEGDPEMMVIFQRLMSPPTRETQRERITTVAGW
ncbi:MAG TPA: SCP2 sterol-binding domain-containing protein [Micromonosporaceae bacterium]|nr:SCP2 sterol-binding domain-containing protein [Micromonosporaceae bacterium]